MKESRSTVIETNAKKRGEIEWNEFLENYINSWPEWKKNSGFCYHTFVFGANRRLSRCTVETQGKNL